MKNSDVSSALTYAQVSGHNVRSVVSKNEPDRHRAKALGDLESALPHKDDLPEGVDIDAVVTTPDFHAGKPVPVGVVVDMKGAVMPHVIGNDIGCGMRMIVLDGLKEDDLHQADLESHLRHIHFQGGRNISLSGYDRHAILREGIPGLLEALGRERRGLLTGMDMKSAWGDVDRTSDDGYFATTDVDPDFAEFGDPEDGHRFDAILGTIGGGNHFVELGVVDNLVDGSFATACGVSKGSVVLVVHSGSLDFGQRVGTAVKEKLKAAGAGRVLDFGSHQELAQRYENGLANAANIAFVNRFLIGLSSIEALRRATGTEVGHRLVYDAPHNTIWKQGDIYRHRKGACSARGVGDLVGSPYQWLGEPVILPGSMGDGTWLLKGLGNADGLSSAAHGAGRRLARQEARGQALVPSQLRVVGPVDPKAANVRSRPDILAEIEGRLKEEAPDAYRPIESVVEPMVEAGLVEKVAKVRPVLTVKG